MDDADVENCLALLTFLPMEEVRRLGALQDSKINEAKEILAYEVTKLVHGEEKASKAQEAERALFAKGGSGDNIPTIDMKADDFKDGMNILDIYMKCGLIPSKGEGRRLMQQGGIKMKGETINDFNRMITLEDFEDGKLLLQKGKKAFKQIKIDQ